MSKPKDKKIEWDQIRVPAPFADWLREEAHNKGRFIYFLLEEYVAKALDGKRPWGTTK